MTIAGRLVAGVDSSTQATKVVLVDTADGTIVATGRAAHEVTGGGGARETDPEVWWTALGAALQATGRAAEVDAISVGGQQHGLVVLDRAGRPLRPALLWNDTRSAPDAAALVAERGAAWWAETTGCVPVASFTVSKWAWLVRTEPALVPQVAAVRLPHDFLTERLTGAAVTDRGDASGTAWLDPVGGAYRADVLELPGVGLDPALLPAVLAPGATAGGVTAGAAAALGIREGIPVGCGTGDNMAAALALGARSGQPVISLGTSGTAYVTSSEPARDPSGVVAGFADAAGGYLPLAATLNCTLAVDRFAALLGLDREDVADGRRGGRAAVPGRRADAQPAGGERAGARAPARHARRARSCRRRTTARPSRCSGRSPRSPRRAGTSTPARRWSSSAAAPRASPGGARWRASPAGRSPCPTRRSWWRSAPPRRPRRCSTTAIRRPWPAAGGSAARWSSRRARPTGRGSSRSRRCWLPRRRCCAVRE